MLSRSVDIPPLLLREGLCKTLSRCHRWAHTVACSGPSTFFRNCVIILFISFCWRSVLLRPSRRLPLWDLMIAVRSLQPLESTLCQEYSCHCPELCMVWRQFGPSPNRIRVAVHCAQCRFCKWSISRCRLLWALDDCSKKRKCLHTE
jgi:hypothetical protein